MSTTDWTQTLTSSSRQLWGAMLAVDAHDAIYVTGTDPNYQIVTARLSAAGALQWQNGFAHAGTREQASWLTVDAFGDVVVAGYSVVGASRTPNGFATLKYDPAGNLLWSDFIQSTAGILARVATDANGDVVVLGRDFSAGIVTIKYSRAGARLWTRTASLSPFNVNAVGALAIGPSGNIYITGGVLGTLLTVAYDAAGTLLWSRTVPAAGSGADLALGPAEEVYVTGGAGGSAADRTLVVKFDAAGNLLWNNPYPGINGYRIAVDGQGDVMVAAGQSTGGYIDWITHKLSPAGARLWSATYDRHRFNDEIPYGLALGPDDEIYVTGQGGPGPTSGNVSDLRTVTVRYSRTGVEEWWLASPLSLRGRGVAHLHDGSVATVGESTFTVFHARQSGVWQSVGGGVAGASGLPLLRGTGTPRSTAPVGLELTRAVPGAPAWLVAGAARVDLPVLGGILVPMPTVILGAFTVAPGGSIALPLTWPPLPSGAELAFQFWILDAAGPFGVAAANGLLGVTD